LGETPVADKEKPKKRGPRGGIKHTPGRGHDSKCSGAKKQRYRRKAAQRRKEKEQAAQKLWNEWDEMPPEQRKLLGPKGLPHLPRPKNEN
jgi:hypothetical protein